MRLLKMIFLLKLHTLIILLQAMNFLIDVAQKMLKILNLVIMRIDGEIRSEKLEWVFGLSVLDLDQRLYNDINQPVLGHVIARIHFRRANLLSGEKNMAVKSVSF
jgi:hypothetical protein